MAHYPNAEEARSDRAQSGFESRVRYHFARLRKQAKRLGSSPSVWRFDFSSGHQFAGLEKRYICLP